MYPQGQSNIGNLLRLIQEDKNQAPAAQIPATDPNSPIRQTIQQPVTSPQSPGSSQIVSLRPEGVIQQGPQAGGNVVPAAQPIAPTAAPVAPASANFSRPVGSSSPSSPSPASAATPSTPFIGTRISSAPSAQKTLGASTAKPVFMSNVAGPSSKYAPKRSGSISGALGGGAGTKNVPTPTPVQPNPIKSTREQLIKSIKQGIGRQQYTA